MASSRCSARHERAKTPTMPAGPCTMKLISLYAMEASALPAAAAARLASSSASIVTRCWSRPPVSSALLFRSKVMLNSVLA